MNLLFIACDTTRVDHLGCYGYFRETTPNIDNLARDGVVFEDFFASGSPTGPSFTCMYTGLHTIRHKYYRFIEPNLRQVDDLIFTMPDILNAWGYTTVAVDNLVDHPPHSKHWVRGYDFYINPNPVVLDIRACDLMAGDVNRRLIPWIKNRPDEEFFLFVHYWDPHIVYNQPQEYRKIFHHEKGNLSDLKVVEAPAAYQYVPGWGRVGDFADGEVHPEDWPRGPMYPECLGSIDLYDGEIRYMDDAIGELVSTLKDEGIFEDTLIIVTSDHGENLFQHNNEWGHLSLHDTVTHVPLIIRHPKKLPKGIRVKGFGQHIDLLPTILDIIGAPTEALDMDGKSLLPLLNGETVRDTLFMEGAWPMRAVRTERWKFINDIMRGTLELYDVENDPLETMNLIETEKEKAKELKRTLDSWVKANLKEGETDPMIYSDTSGLSRARREYQDKIWQLLASFLKANKKLT